MTADLSAHGVDGGCGFALELGLMDQGWKHTGKGSPQQYLVRRDEHGASRVLDAYVSEVSKPEVNARGR